MELNDDTRQLFDIINDKSTLKNDVYDNTLAGFKTIKQGLLDLGSQYAGYEKDMDVQLPNNFEVKPIGNFDVELKFGGDILLFMMHTNVFEFPRKHEVMRTNYVKEDKSRSYCGIINIYNFIADSFKYNRVNDIGYLIGRIFINHDNHYFIEGKRELGFLLNNFGKNALDSHSAETIIKAAIKYTVNFDLLTPNYDLVKFVSVVDMKNTIDAISLKTGKRLGYKFSADKTT